MALASWMSALEGPPKATESSIFVDGGAMRYTVEGRGPDLVLIHGLLGTAASWQYATPALAEESRVHAIDALNIGESDRVTGLDCTLAAQADRLVAFLDERGIARADWAGSSHGGAVLLMLAARHPERVRSLALHAPANPFAHEPDGLIRFYGSVLGRWFAKRVPHLPEWMQALALARMYGTVSEVRHGSLARYIRSLRVPGTVDYVLDVLAGWHREMRTLREALPRIGDIPVLLLWGDHDGVIGRRSGELLQEQLQDAEFCVLPGAGHLPHEEVPQAFASAINAFLRKRARHSARTHPHLISARGIA